MSPSPPEHAPDREGVGYHERDNVERDNLNGLISVLFREEISWELLTCIERNIGADVDEGERDGGEADDGKGTGRHFKLAVDVANPVAEG